MRSFKYLLVFFLCLPIARLQTPESALDFDPLSVTTELNTEVSETIPEVNLTNSSADDEEDDEGDYNDGDEDEEAEVRLRTFVRQYNVSQFLPDDFTELSEKMAHIDVYKQPYQHINDTIQFVKRLERYFHKLSTNKDIADTVLYLSSHISDSLYQARLSPQCMADMANVLQGIKDRNIWAMKFPNSFGEVYLTGLFSGHLMGTGDFDQCIGIKSPSLNDRHIYGKYCHVQLRTFLPPFDSYDPSHEAILAKEPAFQSLIQMIHKAKMSDALGGKFVADDGIVNHFLEGASLVKTLSQVNLAFKDNLAFYPVCVPASCPPEDIEALFNLVVYPLLKTPVKVEERMCQVATEAKPIQLDSFQKFSVITLSIAFSIVLIGTLYHLVILYRAEKSRRNEAASVAIDMNGNLANGEGEVEEKATQATVKATPVALPVYLQVLLAFSAVENTSVLFRYNRRFAALDTIRFMLTFTIFNIQEWGLMLLFMPQMVRGFTYSAPINMGTSGWYWWLRTPGLWNDAFVFTLGVTIIFQQFNRLDRFKGNFSYVAYVFKRWFRLSAALFGILTFIYLYPLAGDGPVWFANDQWFVEPCRKPESLLSTFLYYSNWNNLIHDYRVRDAIPICNFPTWFASMSTQLYLVAPIFFLPLFFYPRLGLALTFGLLGISPLLSSLPRLLTGTPSYVEATKFESMANILSAITHWHMNTSIYFTSLAIGLLTGYLIRQKPHHRIPGGRPVEVTLWLFSLSTVVALYRWNNSLWATPNAVLSGFEVTSWWVVSKFVLPGFLSLTVFLCSTGRGGILTRLLTIRVIQPIAKLSYGIYLMRSITIAYRLTSGRQPVQMWPMQMFQNATFDYLTTACLAYVLYILFEGPSANLVKIFESLNWIGPSKQPTSKPNSTLARDISISSIINKEKQVNMVFKLKMQNEAERAKVGKV